MSFEAPSPVRPSPDVLAINCMWSAYFAATVAGSVAAPTSVTGIAAQEGIFVPIEITTPKTYTHGWWYNGSAATAAGNVCVAVYAEVGFARLATTGAVAAAGNSVIQSGAFAAAWDAVPGRYLMALSISAGAGANAQFAYASSTSHGKAVGLMRQATGVHPLPDPAAPTTWVTQVLPYMGISSFAL